MKVLFPCPACHRLLQPPVQASGNARLRCPLCQHEMVAYDLVQGAHRSWLVIEDSGGEDLFRDFQEERPHKTESRVSEEEYVLQEEADEPESTEANNVTTAEADSKQIQWEKFKPITHDEFQIRKRNAKSPIAGVLQVVLGGLAAIPISLGILWYGLGKDVADAGPWVAQYAPWIVPAKFHRNRSDNGGRMSQRAEAGIGDFPDLSKFDLASTEKEEKKGNQGTAKGEDGAKANDENRRSDKPLPDVAVESTPVAPASALRETPAASEKEGSESKEKPKAVRPPIAVATDHWTASAKAWLEGRDQEDKRSQLAIAYYTSAAEMAKTMALVDRKAPSMRAWIDRCHNLLREHASNPSLQDLIERGAKAMVEPSVGQGAILIVNVEGSSWDGDRLHIDSPLVPIKSVQLPLYRRIRTNESQTGVASRYVPGKMAFLATIEEMDGKLFLSVHEETSF